MAINRHFSQWLFYARYSARLSVVPVIMAGLFGQPSGWPPTIARYSHPLQARRHAVRSKAADLS
jgi:hypothetical protein